MRTQILEMDFEVLGLSRERCAARAPYEITRRTEREAWIAARKEERRPAWGEGAMGDEMVIWEAIEDK